MRHLNRRQLLIASASLPWARPSMAASSDERATMVLTGWHSLVLELVRHTATYSPPVASRAFAYLAVAAYEAVASGNGHMTSLASQLQGLKAAPAKPEAHCDTAVVLHAALAAAVADYFGNTGPTGQRAMAAVDRKRGEIARDGVAADVVERSEAYGQKIAAHVFAWSQDDGGAKIQNLGFPENYEMAKTPGTWSPTSTLALQQKPLLPAWGTNRSFALPDAASCPLPPPPDYSEDANSEFYKQALEVYQTTKSLNDEQKRIARFWSDDPMLSPTPPGHWVSIAMQIFKRDAVPLDKQVDVLMRLGVAVADAFIACWRSKFEVNLLRPVTYIKRLIDPKWEPLLITPPFPEYPSGHSTQSGAAATVMTKAFGENFAFEDATHIKDGIKPRQFNSFTAAAEEAAISRLFGGIHFRAAIERGLEQGRCVGAFANGLKTLP